MSQIHNQLVASHEQMDLDEAQERVQRILHGQAGPTITPAPQTQPQAPAETMRRGISDKDMKKYVEEGIPVPAPRKTRSDKGSHKPKAPVDPDEIVLRLSLSDARRLALKAGDEDLVGLAAIIQDQIIQQLQKRLDALTKGK